MRDFIFSFTGLSCKCCGQQRCTAADGHNCGGARVEFPMRLQIMAPARIWGCVEASTWMELWMIESGIFWDLISSKLQLAKRRPSRLTNLTPHILSYSAYSTSV